MIGDLLRRPGTQAGYIVPTGPGLLAGFTTTIFETQLGLCGLVLLSATPSDPYDIFLHGFSITDWKFGPCALHLEGQFTFVAGSLFQNLPINSGSGAPPVTPNSLSFSGFVEFRAQPGGSTAGVQPVFRGSAAGKLSFDNHGKLVADIKVQVRTSGTIDVGIGDVSLTKVNYSLTGSVQVHFGGTGFEISSSAQLHVDALTAVPGTKTVTIADAETICGPVLVFDPLPDLQTQCVDLPAVTVTVPDLTNVTWQQVFSTDVGLGFAVSGSGIKITANLPSPVGQVTLPDLL